MSDFTEKQLVVKIVKRKIGGLGFVVKKKPSSPLPVVTDIVRGSVAEESGLLRVGDVILEVNGAQVRDIAFDNVLEILNGVPVGKEVTLKVQAASEGSSTQNQAPNQTPKHTTSPLHNGSMVNGGSMNENEKATETQKACPFSGFKPNHKNPKFVRLTNLVTGKQVTDTLHQKVMEPITCTAGRCLGALMDPDGGEAPPPRPTGVPRPKEEVKVHATDFLKQYYASMKLENSPAHESRLAEVLKTIEDTGTYELTEKELAFGAKTAWRNASRCIGRIQWNKLQVFDARHVQTTQGMYEKILAHIRYGTNKGNIRSAITIFPQRRELNKDFRVWNFQLIRYAGYKQPDGSVIGDPANVEMTEVCKELGWEGQGGRFDVLPLVLQANGEQPELFEIPRELIMEVQLKHPSYPWFEQMGLRWYCLPAVSALKLDIGGVEFPAVPFNGWYMVTEIGRDFADEQRYNLLAPIANKLGLDTKSNAALWKDRALVELNAAILYSYQEAGTTLIDHHTASEQFMKHMANEEKLRGGIPADWVWIVPPMSGGVTPVFHQEMLNYILKPSYDYQADAWKVTPILKHKENAISKKRLAFKEVAKAVKFSAKLMGQAMAKRYKAIILYATETGKSESYAKMLGELFSYAFDPKVMCMETYPHPELENEDLVLIVTSTFGNGDPPENGEAFARYLYELRHPSSNEKSSASRLRKTNRLTSLLMQKERDKFLRIKDDSQPLANLRFSVFGLGSRAYPNFCAFARSVDRLVKELGGEQILPMAEGDELCGQEESFKTWAGNVFRAACETFCVGDDINTSTVTESLSTISSGWEPNHFRFKKHEGKPVDLCENLSTTHGHGKTIHSAKAISTTNLQAPDSGRRTLLVKLSTGSEDGGLDYKPGDHIALYPANRPELVQALVDKLQDKPDDNDLVTVEMCREEKGIFGPVKIWEPVNRLPASCTLRGAFSRFIDITSSPTPQMLSYLSTQATSSDDKERLELLGQGETLYEDWKYEKQPNIVEVIEEFPSLKVSALLLLTQLPLLQPRFYSISSSPVMFPGEIHITVSVVHFTKRGGKGPVHYGVCSTWLDGLNPGDLVPCYVRQAHSFHMPDDGTVPIIMVGPGTGIAPFRSFWQQRQYDRARNPGLAPKARDVTPEPSPEFPRRRFVSSPFSLDSVSKALNKKSDKSPRDNSLGNTLVSPSGWGEMYLFFGCRNSKQDCIYRDEILQAKDERALTQVHTALSREPNQPKRYVQDKLKEAAFEICDMMVSQRGHFYVCGDVSMAADVCRTLQTMLEGYAAMSQTEAQEFIDKLKTAGRYHEDIFGVTLRTREVTNRVRTAAKKAWVYVSDRKIIRARSSSTSKSSKDVETSSTTAAQKRNISESHSTVTRKTSHSVRRTSATVQVTEVTADQNNRVRLEVPNNKLKISISTLVEPNFKQRAKDSGHPIWAFKIPNDR